MTCAEKKTVIPVGSRKAKARKGCIGTKTKNRACRYLLATPARTSWVAITGGEVNMKPYAAAASKNAGSHSPEFASSPDKRDRSSLDVSGPAAASMILKRGPNTPNFSGESSFQAGVDEPILALATKILLIISLVVNAAAAKHTVSLKERGDDIFQIELYLQ